MTRIMIIGAGSAHLAAALRALDSASEVAENSVRVFVSRSRGVLIDQPWFAPVPPADDPFAGGGRSKGEKKRAARERRMRGGY